MRKKKSWSVQLAAKSAHYGHCSSTRRTVDGWWRLAAVGSCGFAVGGGWCWLVAVGGWFVVVGGSWLLAVGGWQRLEAVGGWRLVAVGGW